VRSQFKMAVGKFEGVEEALTRIGAYTYMMDATRTMTAGAIDLGEKPSVVSAIAKYHVTERARQVVNDGMDIDRRQGHLPWPLQLHGPRLPADADRHHRRRRQHPDAQPDHLRPGRHPLPSVPAAEMQAAQNPDVKKGTGQFRQGLVGPHRLHHQEWIPRPVAGHDRLALCCGQRRNVAPEMKRYYQQ
jgi:acyl-CoA dehydrogenase